MDSSLLLSTPSNLNSNEEWTCDCTLLGQNIVHVLYTKKMQRLHTLGAITMIMEVSYQWHYAPIVLFFALDIVAVLMVGWLYIFCVK